MIVEPPIVDGHVVMVERPETVADYAAAIEAHIDTVAKGRAYSGAVSLASYLASTNPQWAAEAQAFVAWRGAVWIYAYAEMDKVLSAQRPQPTIPELIAELPAITWPEVS